MLLLWTICQAYGVASICSYYKAGEVIGATITVAGMVFGLTLYAFFTRGQFKLLHGLATIIVFTTSLLGLFGLLWYSNWVYIVTSYLCIILFGIYLVIDTQFIVGKGRHGMD
mmetsp:Transcript_22485/g.30873  ORF Transcript_22485/g.30873 Transcript_22485/m.30873 type:complete len:112 (+) Transcript_22485:267-602(+)